MKFKKEAGIIVFLVILISFLAFVFAEDSDTITLETNVLTGLPVSNESMIQIEVPDYLFIGNVSVGDLSDETNITINNNSTVKIKVISELVNSSDKIFSHLILKEYGGKYKGVDDFSMNITGKTKKVYMKLNLTDFEEDLENDLIGHQSQLRFIAMEA